jgi:hypothetical protein
MADSDVKRHPIRGFFWGLLMGVGVYLLLGGMKVIAFGELNMLLIILGAAVVLNVLWAMFGPAKQAKPPKGYTGPAEPQAGTAFADTWTPPPAPEVPVVPTMESTLGDPGPPEPD